MAQLPRETDEMEIKEPQEVLVLTDCVIINKKDYDGLMERINKFHQITEKRRNIEIEVLVNSAKIVDLDENACKLALKNGIVLKDFLHDYAKRGMQEIADKYLMSVEEVEKQAYDSAMNNIEVMLRIKKAEQEKGKEQQ